MFKIRIASRRGAKAAASIAALILLPLSLTACGGDDSSSSLDGTYYYFHNETEGSQLIIDGTSAVFRDFDTEEPSCGIDTSKREDAVGTIDDEGTQIMWDPTFEDIQYIYDNRMEDDTSPVKVMTSGDAKVVTVGGFAFTSDGPDICD